MNELREGEEAIVRVPIVRDVVEVRVPITVVLVEDEHLAETNSRHTIAHQRHPCHCPWNILKAVFYSEPVRSPVLAPSSSCLRNAQRYASCRYTIPLF